MGVSWREGWALTWLEVRGRSEDGSLWIEGTLRNTHVCKDARFAPGEGGMSVPLPFKGVEIGG